MLKVEVMYFRITGAEFSKKRCQPGCISQNDQVCKFDNFHEPFFLLLIARKTE